MLGTTNKLALYVHPRYITFTIILTLISVVILLAANPTEKIILSRYSLFLCILVAAVALALPARSLSERTAQLRSQSIVAINSTRAISSYDHFSQDYSNFTLQDWASLLSKSPGNSQLTGKKATIEGFIYENDNVRYVARFRLSCCAVDATPISLPLKNTEQISQLSVGSWQHIEGVFVLENDKLVIEPTEISEISEPEQPYVY